MGSEEGSGGKVIPVRVAVRLRPLSSREIREGCQECIDVTHDSPQVSYATFHVLCFCSFILLLYFISLWFVHLVIDL